MEWFVEGLLGTVGPLPVVGGWGRPHRDRDTVWIPKGGTGSKGKWWGVITDLTDTKTPPHLLWCTDWRSSETNQRTRTRGTNEREKEREEKMASRAKVGGRNNRNGRGGRITNAHENEKKDTDVDDTHVRGREQRIMTQPINLIFRFLQSGEKVLVWLYENTDLRIEGKIVGFDEYMNLVLDEAAEVSVKRNTKKSLGKILLKGDNITLLQVASP
eukprot:scaffold2028_cov353-Pavlova_lutheri.AAC.3